jgi:KaiC/GvpD/RAD55 family RecA-like ATPase
MVIDSITSFSLLFDDQLLKRQSVLALFDIIHKWDCTTVFTVQHDPADKNNLELSLIESEADSIVLLYYLSVKNKLTRFIEVFKMRGTNHSKEAYSFMIDKGIKIGKKANIKNKPC